MTVSSPDLAMVERALNVEGAVELTQPKRWRLYGLIAMGSFAALAVTIGMVFGPEQAFFVAVLAVIGGLTAVRAAMSTRLKFLPEGILTEKAKTAPSRDSLTRSLLPYGDIDTIVRDGSAVLVVAGNRSMRLLAGSEEEPDHAMLADLQAYLESKVSEARALADQRATVSTYLRQAEGASDYRHPPAPTSALEAIARARGMPLQLRVEAARAIGEEAELEVSDELKLISPGRSRREP